MNLMDLATAVVAGRRRRDRAGPRREAAADRADVDHRRARCRRTGGALRLAAARVVAWSGDNPCSLIGTGLVREGRVAISLGTSDTIFGLMPSRASSADGTGHVFGAPTGDYMGMTVFKNGSLARERVRDAYGLTWAEFSRALRRRAGNTADAPPVVRAGDYAARADAGRPSVRPRALTTAAERARASSKRR